MAAASAASLTWGPEEPALGWIVRPRVTPPLSAFFRLSFTSVISSSRLTRSSSFTLHSSSTFFSRSDSDAWDRLPCGCRGRRKVQLPGSDDSVDIFRATTKRLINRPPDILGTLSLESPLTGSGLHGRAQVSPLLLQLGQVVSDVILPLRQLFLFGLQPLGVGLHAVLAVLALLRICRGQRDSGENMLCS